MYFRKSETDTFLKLIPTIYSRPVDKIHKRKLVSPTFRNKYHTSSFVDSAFLRQVRWLLQQTNAGDSAVFRNCRKIGEEVRFEGGKEKLNSIVLVPCLNRRSGSAQASSEITPPRRERSFTLNPFSHYYQLQDPPPRLISEATLHSQLTLRSRLITLIN